MVKRTKRKGKERDNAMQTAEKNKEIKSNEKEMKNEKRAGEAGCETKEG